MRYLGRIVVIVGLIALALTDVYALQARQLTSRSAAARRAYEQAEGAWGRKDFQNSRLWLNRALDADPRFIEATLLLAEVYFTAGEFMNSISFYQKALQINPAFFPQARYFLARAFLNTGDYQNALLQWEQALSEGKLSARLQASARAGLQTCHFAIHAMAHPVPFDPVNLGPQVNSDLPEYSPALTVDEKILVFTRKVPDATTSGPRPRFQEDFFITQETGPGLWELAQPFDQPINTWWNEGAQALSADGREMFYTACNRPDGFGSCDLYYSRRTGLEWSEPRNMGATLNSAGWDSQPSISADGNSLYFASSRGGGVGDMDIWVSIRNPATGQWNTPQNLGPTINTPAREMSPFIHADNKTLYFASEGHIGMGGLDLFISRRDSSGNWTAPVNLGYPLNTFADEFSLVVGAGGVKAFFASAREGGFGDSDLYAFTLHPNARPSPVTYMRGIVFDSETQRRIRAGFQLVDLNTGQNFIVSESDAITGEFLVAIPAGLSLALHVSHPGYLFFSDHFSIADTHTRADPFLRNIALKPIKEGETVVLRNIFFDTGSYQLKPESVTELMYLASLLERNPALHIQISGHTDNVGSFDYNLQLSQNRARSVVRFLVENGIQPQRLTYSGYADTRPIDTNLTEQGRANNRRTEFTLLSK